jgi:large subunit ribosomal protein L10
MNRQEKQLMVESLKNDFAASQCSFLINFQGMTVEQLQELRKALRQKGGKVQVAKARLMKLAVDDIAGIKEMSPYFKHQVALIFAKQEPSVIAKIILDVSKQNDKLAIVAGIVEKKLLDKQGVEFVALLPSREVLLSQLAGVLKSPTTQLASVLNQLIIRLLLVLKAVGQKKQ